MALTVTGSEQVGYDDCNPAARQRPSSSCNHEARFVHLFGKSRKMNDPAGRSLSDREKQGQMDRTGTAGKESSLEMVRVHIFHLVFHLDDIQLNCALIKS